MGEGVGGGVVERQTNTNTDAKRERERPLALLPREKQEAEMEASQMSEWSDLLRLLSPEGEVTASKLKKSSQG